LDCVSPLQGVAYFKGILLGVCVFFMDVDRVVRSGTEVVDAEGVVIIEFCEFFGEQLDGQKIKLEGKGNSFLLGFVSMIEGRVLNEGGELDGIELFV
jgi:hypothetical protein